MFMHAINQRPLSYMTSIEHDLTLAPHLNYVFDLSYLTGLQLVGERSAEFLQGQLTCDVRDVTTEKMGQGALCNLKGRILALMDVIHWDNQGFHLIIPNDLRLETEATLSKTASFSKVSLHHARQYTPVGLYLQNPGDLLPKGFVQPNTPFGVITQTDYCCYHVGDRYYVLLVNNDHLDVLCHPFINRSQYRGSLTWHALQLQAHQISIYPETRGAFLPHRLGLQTTHYLSFNKGCYKGQEIIARTHYRATLKHELKIAHITTAERLWSGQSIYSPHDQQDIGELIDYCPISESQYVIAASLHRDAVPELRFEGHVQTVLCNPIEVTH